MYIYKTTNTVNGKIYIGQSTKQYSSSYLGSGLKLKRAIRKYGRKCFKVELLCRCETKIILNIMEDLWILMLNTRNSKIGYNIIRGGQSRQCFVRKKYIHKEETKRKISEKMKGRKLSDEHRQNMSKSFKGVSKGKGRRHSDETKNRQSIALKGKTKTKEHRIKLSLSHMNLTSGMKGKKHSVESNIKNSIAHKDRRYVNNGNINKMIHAYEVEQYLKLGYVMGMIKRSKRNV